MVLELGGAFAADFLASLLADLVTRHLGVDAKWRRKNSHLLAQISTMIRQSIESDSSLSAYLEVDEDLQFHLGHFFAFDLAPIIGSIISTKSAGTFDELVAGYSERVDELLNFADAEGHFDSGRVVTLIGDAVDSVLSISGIEVPESVRNAGTAEATTSLLGRIARDLEVVRESVVPADRISIGQAVSALKRAGSGEFETLPLPDLVEPRVVDLTAVYVNPTLVSDDRSRTTGSEIELVSGRHAIIGNPGAGKTTLLRRLGSMGINNASLPAPLLVPLRLFESDLQDGRSLVGTIAEQVRRVLGTALPDLMIDRMLRAGALLPLLDGIDELASPMARLSLFAQLRGFADQFPACPVATTARIQGFDWASLSGSFAILTLQDLSTDRVVEYAHKWFEGEGRPELIEPFLADSEHVSDLRVSPLLLALLCLLYTASGMIPENRSLVYARCSDLLFREWDRHRRIQIGEEFDDFLGEALEELAFAFFKLPEAEQENESAQEFVDEDGFAAPVIQVDGAVSVAPRGVVIDRIADFLFEWHVGDRLQAVRVAEEFIRFCEGRLWIMTEMGTDSVTGEPLLGFVHKTFLEFYCGTRIARTLSPEELLSLVRFGADEAGFRPVLEVALQVRDRASRGSISLLMESFLTRLGVGEVSGFAGVELVLRSVTVKPAVARTLAELCVSSIENDPPGDYEVPLLADVLTGAFAAARRANANLLADALSTLLMNGELVVAPEYFSTIRTETLLLACSSVFPITDTVRFADAAGRFLEAILFDNPPVFDVADWRSWVADGNRGSLLKTVGSALRSASRTESLLSEVGASILFLPFDDVDDRGGSCMAESTLSTVFSRDLGSRIGSRDWTFGVVGWLASCVAAGELERVFKQPLDSEWSAAFASAERPNVSIPVEWMAMEGVVDAGFGHYVERDARLFSIGVAALVALCEGSVRSNGAGSFAEELLLGELLRFSALIEIVAGRDPSELSWQSAWEGMDWLPERLTQLSALAESWALS